MGRRLWVTFGGLALLFFAAWTYFELQTRSMNRNIAEVDELLDEAEKDIGTYDPETSRDEPTMKRAMRMAQEQKDRAEAKQREMDSLIRIANEDYYLPDTSFTDR